MRIAGPLGLLLLGGAAVAGAATAARGLRAPDSIPPEIQAALDQEILRSQETLEADLELWQDHSTWESRWRVRSEHYEVHTTQSYAFGKFLCDSLESMLPRFEEVTGRSLPSGPPMTIYVFPDLVGYNALGDSFAEHSSFYGSFYADGQQPEAVATYYQDNPTLMRMWVTHSALHQFLDRAAPGVTVPDWIGEGLASYFSLFWAYDYGVDQFEDMRERGRLLSVEQLLDADLSDYTNRSHERLIQIGMLFTYLNAIRPDTRSVSSNGEVEAQPFVDYLRTRLAGRAAPADPVRKLLFGDSKPLTEELHAFTGWR